MRPGVVLPSAPPAYRGLLTSDPGTHHKSSSSPGKAAPCLGAPSLARAPCVSAGKRRKLSVHHRGNGMLQGPPVCGFPARFVLVLYCSWPGHAAPLHLQALCDGEWETSPRSEPVVLPPASRDLGTFGGMKLDGGVLDASVLLVWLLAWSCVPVDARTDVCPAAPRARRSAVSRGGSGGLTSAMGARGAGQRVVRAGRTFAQRAFGGFPGPSICSSAAA